MTFRIGEIQNGVEIPKQSLHRPNRSKYEIHELQIGQCRTIYDTEIRRTRATCLSWASAHGWTIVMKDSATEKRGNKLYGNVTVWRDKDRTEKTARQKKKENGLQKIEARDVM